MAPTYPQIFPCSLKVTQVSSPPHPCLEGFIFGQVISIALLINIIFIKEKVMVGEKGGWGRGLHMPVIVSTVRPQCSDSLL